MSRRAEGQLFIGRLNKSTRVRDLEDVFEPYGRMTRCEVKYGKNALKRYNGKYQATAYNAFKMASTICINLVYCEKPRYENYKTFFLHL